MIGQTLNNRYEITARLGKGAMGTVYRATEAQYGREVALKIISSDLIVDPDMLERFKREGEALSKLKHPNIVGYLDAFQHGEHYVIVMEYVSEGSLYDLIKLGPLPIERARQITLDLCDALIRAHRLNIIHRDIKPENILIDEDGTPKLADFGVARLQEGTRMTRSGTQVGTPYYMSPEAWEGKTLDAQADIWSLGVILFEMLTGQVPFGGDTGAAVMNKVLTTPPPDLKKLRAEVPSGLVKIVSRMLTRDKKRRYQTMREVAVDLERVQQRTTPVPTKTGPKVQAQLTKNVTILSTIKSALPKTLPFLRIAGFAGIAIALFGIGLWAVPKFIPLLQILRASPTPTETSTPAFQIGSTIISDKDEMILLYVPAGEFTMGRDNRSSNEKPMHTVYLDAFWIDKTEVTNAMYARCIQDGKCSQPTSPKYYNDSTYANHPVVYVSWENANAYCSWANRRLPTEAEWEKAASWDEKNQTKYVYPWGNNTPNNDLSNYNGVMEETTEVGNYPSGASPYGALDMAGNVWEWVADWYDPFYYSTLGENVRNPPGPNSGQYKVLRGGSWSNEDYFVRSAVRYGVGPALTGNYIGFRCSQSP
jgi:eukaryotic-like serine/threonine-protein kinase